MLIDELKKKILDGPWPDRELVVQMVTSGDPEKEVTLHEIEVGVGFMEMPDGSVLFPCKFEAEPELFILVHRDGKFIFKDEECQIQDSDPVAAQAQYGD